MNVSTVQMIFDERAKHIASNALRGGFSHIAREPCMNILGLPSGFTRLKLIFVLKSHDFAMAHDKARVAPFHSQWGPNLRL